MHIVSNSFKPNTATLVNGVYTPLYVSEAPVDNNYRDHNGNIILVLMSVPTFNPAKPDAVKAETFGTINPKDIEEIDQAYSQRLIQQRENANNVLNTPKLDTQRLKELEAERTEFNKAWAKKEAELKAKVILTVPFKPTTAFKHGGGVDIENWVKENDSDAVVIIQRSHHSEVYQPR